MNCRLAETKLQYSAKFQTLNFRKKFVVRLQIIHKTFVMIHYKYHPLHSLKAGVDAEMTSHIMFVMISINLVAIHDILLPKANTAPIPAAN